jgi:hypothetical protein
MHQQLWGYKVEWKSVSRGTGGKKVEYHCSMRLVNKLYTKYPKHWERTEQFHSGQCRTMDKIPVPKKYIIDWAEMNKYLALHNI